MCTQKVKSCKSIVGAGEVSNSQQVDRDLESFYLKHCFKAAVYKQLNVSQSCIP